MFRSTVIALVCLFPLNTGKKVSVGHCNHDIDTIIKTVFRKAKAVTVTLNSDDLITLATARTGKPGTSSRMVYFSACLTGHVNNVKPGQPLVFKNVMVNRGGGYNPNNGSFVCPVSGDYWFSLDYLTSRGPHVEVAIQLNGKAVANTYANPKGHHKSVTRSVIIALRKLDVVAVVNKLSGGGFHGGPYTGFSGYLM